MPGAQQTRDKLNNFTAAPDEKVCRDPYTLQRLIIGMYGRIKPIGEKLNYPISAKFFRWQADMMNHQQTDIGIVGACVTIGRRYVCCINQ